MKKRCLRLDLKELNNMRDVKKQLAWILKGMRKAGIKNPEDYPWGWDGTMPDK
jgi:hypothetical protein